MVCGYTEPDYLVIARKNKTLREGDSVRQGVFELREDNGVAYISFERPSEGNSNYIRSTLYLYNDPEIADLDWASIKDGESIDTEAFNHNERIEDHATGYRKNGLIVMY